ncbi:MAG TPA: hypothetical protein VFT72_18930 [Opitutaceae bacterium]|nr:hypothetical protein [Opitutaceae bacterium]
MTISRQIAGHASVGDVLPTNHTNCTKVTKALAEVEAWLLLSVSSQPARFVRFVCFV